MDLTERKKIYESGGMIIWEPGMENELEIIQQIPQLNNAEITITLDKDIMLKVSKYYLSGTVIGLLKKTVDYLDKHGSINKDSEGYRELKDMIEFLKTKK